jgi:hypothetical protein
VADHALFVGVGEGAPLERRHRRERLDQPRPALDEHALVESHPAQVEPEPELRLVDEQRLVALPERSCVHGLLLRRAF